MQISEWINLSLAIATVSGVAVALVFGIRSMRESRRIQLVRHKSEMLEKISTWLGNVQACLPFGALFKPPEPLLKLEASLVLELREHAVAFGNVLEQGRGMYGIAVFFGNDLSEAVKSLQAALQSITEMFFKYSKLLIETSKDDFDRVFSELERENRGNMESLNKAEAELHGKIFSARISLLDSISSGSDPFSDIK